MAIIDLLRYSFAGVNHVGSYMEKPLTFYNVNS